MLSLRAGAVRVLVGAFLALTCVAAPAAAEPSPTPTVDPTVSPSSPLSCVELAWVQWERDKWIQVSGNKATVDCTLAAPLESPLDVQLAVFTKDDGSHWPTNQTLYKYDIKTLQAEGDYHWEIELPTADDKVCASQIDFFRGGTVIPKLLDTGWDQLGFNNIIDGRQFDQPDSPPCQPPPTPTPTPTASVAGTTVTSTSGTLPATGYDPAPWLAVAMLLALSGAALVAFAPVKAVK